jgi:hypothetical protein
MVLGDRAKGSADHLEISAHGARQLPLNRGRIRVEVDRPDVIFVVVGIRAPETLRSICPKNKVAALLSQSATYQPVDEVLVQLG